MTSSDLRSEAVSVDLPTPEGAERTKRMPERRGFGLFNVGELFAEPVQLGLRLDDEA